MEEGLYLKTGRLADVLALIQVLGIDEHAYRSEDGIQHDIGEPKSALSWKRIAKDHPEFFRVSPDAERGMSLLARHVAPRVEGEKSYGLKRELIEALLKTAIELHDREFAKSEQWKHIVPLVAAFVTAGVALIVAAAK
jgi:hypothetical protein